MFYPSGGLMIRVRGSGDAARVMGTIRRGLQRAMPGNSYVTIRPFAEIVGEQTRSWRLGATVFLAFGFLALVVAAVGLYSVAGYDVTQRSREFGVRVALGARGADIARLVIGQGLGYVLIGIALGAGIALLAGNRVQPLLFRQSARDPSVFGAVILVLVLVAVVATLVPARRAALVDPNAALKAD
jgi:ABC-type antimicrobial peptide transport system permease subunit